MKMKEGNKTIYLMKESIVNENVLINKVIKCIKDKMMDEINPIWYNYSADSDFVSKEENNNETK